MNAQGMLFIALVNGMLSVSRAFTYLEQFPEVTCEDSELLNITCNKKNFCSENRDSDNLYSYNCNCCKFCSEYDTCCVDSQFRDKERKFRKPYNCVKVYRSKYFVFMIDNCDPSWYGENSIETLCKASAEEFDDLFLAVPVTNRKTGITYRNYYCSVCNKDNVWEQLTFWHWSLNSISRDIEKWPVPSIHFTSLGSGKGFWSIGNGGSSVDPVPYVPTEIGSIVHVCAPNGISHCSNDWDDEIIEGKCAAYMTILRVYTCTECFPLTWKEYRNPHCALCNYVSLDEIRKSKERENIKSNEPPIKEYDTKFYSTTFFVRLFSIYDKGMKCDDSEVYDTIANKCRKVYKG